MILRSPRDERGRAVEAARPAASRPAPRGAAAPGLVARSRLRSWGPYAAAVAVILAAWQAAALALPEFLMPGVPKVLARLGRDLAGGEIAAQALGSLGRLAIGYGVSLVLGTLLGLAAGLADPLRRTLRAAVVILQSIPSIAWVPLLLILMGFGDAPIVVAVAIAAFFPTALAVLNATEGVPDTLVRAGRVMGASRTQLLRRVHLPAVLPELLTGAQVAFGNAWRALISAEMIVGFGAGLGRRLAYSGEIADMPGVLGGILVVAALAALIDQVVLEGAKRRLLAYR